MAGEIPLQVHSIARVGAIPVVKAMCERLGLVQLVDELIPIAPQAQVSRGQALQALVINRLHSPTPLYRVTSWAQELGDTGLLGVGPAQLTDDRLGRLLDAVAEQSEFLKAAICLRAIDEFGLEIGYLHWDLTSLEFTGAYEREDSDDWPAVRLGFDSCGENKRVRVGSLTLGDGAVGGLLHKVYDGNATDLNTVMDYLPIFGQLRDRYGTVPRIIGDSKLASHQNLEKLDAAGLEFLCPEQHSRARDFEFLGLPEDGWATVDYVPERDLNKKPEDRAGYKIQETRARFERVKDKRFRRFYVVSSSKRAAAAQLRAKNQERIETKLKEARRKFSSSTWRRKTRDEAVVAVDKVLAGAAAGHLYEYSLTRASDDQSWELAWSCDVTKLEVDKRLDGYYTLVTNAAPDVGADTIFRDWKAQNDAERRFADWKGPLRVRPVFLKSPKRILGLVLILSIALLIYTLIEREVRHQLKHADGRMVGLLPVKQPVRATSRNIFDSLKSITFVGFRDAQCLMHWSIAELTPVQSKLLCLLGVSPNGLIEQMRDAKPPPLAR